MAQRIFGIALIVVAGAALAQTPSIVDDGSAASSTSSVAYVYVSRPTHIDAFAANASGKLTLIGSPISGSVSHLSVTPKYLFGVGDDREHIDTYSIASNGAIKYLTRVNAQSYLPDYCSSLGSIALDRTGTTLYNEIDCLGYQAFRIMSNGDLQFLKNTDTGLAADVFFFKPISVLGNNKFAYQFGSAEDSFEEPARVEYKRTSNGELEVLNYSVSNDPFPTPKNASNFYIPGVSAADGSDHLAVALQEYDSELLEWVGPPVLATLTADSEGKLSTSSTYKNMPATSVGYVTAISISPGNNLVAVGGPGFQVFHFNGGSPITKLTEKISTSGVVEEFAWDKSGHLYVLTSKYLYVYHVTSSEVKQAAGSPYSIPEASSLIVLNR